jgi:hypothetical protein
VLRFLTFEMREQADEVWLSIKAPEEARPTADALFEPFVPRNSEAQAAPSFFFPRGFP